MTSEATYAAALRRLAAGDAVAARAICDSALASDPRDSDCLNLLGTLCFRERRFTEAASFFSRAVEVRASDSGMRINLASALMENGDLASAAEHYAIAAQIDPKAIDVSAAAEAFLKIGQEKLSQHKFLEAAAALAGAIRLEDESIDAKVMLIKNPGVSVPVFQAMAAAMPDHIGIKERLAFALSRAGRADEARSVFRTLAQLLADGDTEAAFFHHAYNDGLMATGTQPMFRRRRRFRSLSTVLHRIKGLNGDIAECGCLWGLSAYMISRHMQLFAGSFDGSGFHIFDSFEGLSEPLELDRQGAEGRVKSSMRKGHFAASLDIVARNLAAFPGIKYYRGWIPSRFHEVQTHKFKFLNLDVDLYEPTRDSIMFFYPRLVPGGIIISDDYNWPGCREAMRECSAKFGYEIELTDTDQAIITKR